MENRENRVTQEAMLFYKLAEVSARQKEQQCRLSSCRFNVPVYDAHTENIHVMASSRNDNLMCSWRIDGGIVYNWNDIPKDQEGMLKAVKEIVKARHQLSETDLLKRQLKTAKVGLGTKEDIVEDACTLMMDKGVNVLTYELPQGQQLKITRDSIHLDAMIYDENGNPVKGFGKKKNINAETLASLIEKALAA